MAIGAFLYWPMLDYKILAVEGLLAPSLNAVYALEQSNYIVVLTMGVAYLTPIEMCSFNMKVKHEYFIINLKS